jgi:hypothetical protein
LSSIRAFRLRQRLHCALEVLLLVMPVERDRRRRVGVAEQVLDGADVAVRRRTSVANASISARTERRSIR